ncbi:hypothetical protein CEXT_196361 [Caerostris extrusa]|uniref:Uncharacterized protein n=1 Tax=Caerostris extrusa TaxID=172846 RepID=A0AAV4MAK9_CAEEX|nr:hypothetical protein CEXT_196361 [Caerostris extrusa]
MQQNKNSRIKHFRILVHPATRTATFFIPGCVWNTKGWAIRVIVVSVFPWKLRSGCKNALLPGKVAPKKKCLMGFLHAELIFGGTACCHTDHHDCTTGTITSPGRRL